MNKELGIKNFAGGQEGFSIMEMLLAMVILILAITAVILVSFGNQSILSDSQTSAEALSKAQALIEQQQSLARKDFNLVNATNATDGIYTKSVSVVQQSDYFTKKVTATVNWTGDHNRSQSTGLAAYVTNFENAVGGNTCNSSVGGQNWTTPQYTSYNFVNGSGNLLTAAVPADTYPVSAIDVYNNKMYLTVSATGLNTSPTFFVFTIPAPGQRPVYSGSVDNAATVKAGLNDVVVDGNYAYVANGYGATFSGTGSCSQGSNCAQLQIINLSTYAVTNFKVPSVGGAGGQSIGKSIFYKNGVIYLGLAATGGNGPEFNIIDVHSPTSPVLVGSYSMGTAVNSIFVKGNYAYLATPNAREVTVLNISNPASPVLTTPSAGYDAPDSQGNGKSLDLVGDTLYLGRTLTASNPEFYILNNSDPTNLQPNNTAPAAQDIGDSINALLVRDYLAYLLTNHQLQTWKIDNTASLSQYNSAFTLPGSSSGTALECEANVLYVGSADSSSNGYLTIVQPGP